MELKLLVQTADTKIFIRKETDKSLEEVYQVIEQIKNQGNTVLFALIKKPKGKGKEENWIYDANGNKFVAFVLNKWPMEYCLPSCFINNNSLNGQVEFDGLSDFDLYFFVKKVGTYDVKFPLLTWNSIRKFYTNFFVEHEITQEKFDKNFGTEEEDCLNYTDIMKEAMYPQAFIDFINNQLEFVENMIISNNIKVSKKDFTSFKDFFDNFIQGPIRNKTLQRDVSDGFYDRFDFSTPRMSRQQLNKLDRQEKQEKQRIEFEQIPDDEKERYNFVKNKYGSSRR